MVAENRRVPTLSNLSLGSWYLILFEDKQGSKSGGVDILCFGTLYVLLIVFKVLSSLFSPF